VALIFGCGDATEPRTPTSIVLIGRDTLHVIHDTVAMTAQVLDQNGHTMPVMAMDQWVTSNTDVITVSSVGVVMAQGNGSAHVTARVGKVNAEKTIVVAQVAKSIAISGPTDTVRALGVPVTFTALARDSGNTALPPGAQWQSADPAIATVNPATGVVTTAGNGSTWIRAISGPARDSVSIVVRQRVDLTKSFLTVSQPRVFAGDTVIITFDTRDSNQRRLTYGGLVGSMGIIGGTSPWNIADFTDVGDGTYTLKAVGGAPGEPTTAVGNIDGVEPTGRPAPTIQVVGFTKIAVNSSPGFEGTCGILTIAELYCWGNQFNGFRGSGAATGAASDPVPSLVAGDHKWIDVDINSVIGCGITDSGKLFCWGQNGQGEIGDGTIGANVLAPKPVNPESTYVAVSLEYAQNGGCALTAAHNVSCWGSGIWGRLGNGADTNALRHVAVAGGFKFKAISSSIANGCGVTDAGGLMCWGHWALLGGSSAPDDCGGTQCAKAPLALNAGTSFKETIVNDGYKGCAITTTDIASCWGPANAGLSGVAGGLTWQAIGGGRGDNCGVAGDHFAYCWGYDIHNRFGTGNTGYYQTTPVKVPGTVTFDRLAMSETHVCAIATDGNAYCWGSNGHGQLGDRTTNPSATPVRVRLFAP